MKGTPDNTVILHWDECQTAWMELPWRDWVRFRGFGRGGTSLLAGAEAGEHYFLVCVLGDGGELANVIPHRNDTPTTRSRPTRPASSARRNMRVFTVASAMPIISATSLTDLDRPRTSVPGRTSRHRKEPARR